MGPDIDIKVILVALISEEGIGLLECLLADKVTEPGQFPFLGVNPQVSRSRLKI